MFCICFAHWQVRLTGNNGDRAVHIEVEIGRKERFSVLRLKTGDGTISIERDLEK